MINSGCVLYTGNGISIGRNVQIAANCTLAPTTHELMDPDKPVREQGLSAEPRRDRHLPGVAIPVASLFLNHDPQHVNDTE